MRTNADEIFIAIPFRSIESASIARYNVSAECRRARDRCFIGANLFSLTILIVSPSDL